MRSFDSNFGQNIDLSVVFLNPFRHSIIKQVMTAFLYTLPNSPFIIILSFEANRAHAIERERESLNKPIATTV